MICGLLNFSFLARIEADFLYSNFKKEPYMNLLEVCVKTRKCEENVLAKAAFEYKKLEEKIIGFNQRAA